MTPAKRQLSQSPIADGMGISMAYGVPQGARMALLLPLLLLASAPRADTVDVLIRGGQVYDGSGGPARQVDIGIKGDRIVFVGDAARITRDALRATRTIDATGL